MDTQAAPIEEPATSTPAHDHHHSGDGRHCQQCGLALEGMRSDAKFCSGLCRKRAQRGLPAPDYSRDIASSVGAPRSPLSRLGTRLAGTERRSGGRSQDALFVLADAEQGPQFIRSRYSQKLYPRTYLEHGLRYPDHLRVKPR